MDTGKKLKRIIMINILVLCVVCGGYLAWKHIPLKYKVVLRLMRDRPEIINMQDEFEKVNIIRDWVYENTIIAGDSETYSSEDAQLYLEKLVNKQSITCGYYCGGIASVLSYVYIFFGYDACSLDMAFFEEDQVLGSHVVTLVYVGGLWLVEDATFNITFVDEYGTQLDVLTLRGKVVKDEYIDIKHGKQLFRKCVLSSAQYGGIYEIKDSFMEECETRYFVEQNTAIDVYLEKNSELFAPFLIKDGLEVTPASFYMYPYTIYIPEGARNNALFEDLIQNLNISK